MFILWVMPYVHEWIYYSVCLFQDYHVIAVYGCEKYGYCVLDLDTTLPFPVSFKEYVKKAVRSENNENNIFRR